MILTIGSPLLMSIYPEILKSYGGSEQKKLWPVPKVMVIAVSL